ncbi:hypothetical protein [Polynucleobacter sp. MWH-UH25E]|uniref:hypothetical protein n=1 Tax=Polynucleobacter sp. MWH-UH25E TaxID=1855616 RepID=UPI001BFDBE9E|nr:hypothetical protein [Polynucleobacter sp. MWH-UH25E]QWD62581.1 hypothetical protein ICV39_02905 [Polynucleobacter sp. MWH-UH25E]
MKTLSKITIFLCIGICAGLAQAQTASEASPMPKIADSWRFEITPYIWGPGIKGTLNFNNSLAKSADMNTSNVLSDLKSGGMIAAEAHYGNWGIMGDLVSATLQNSGSIPVYGGAAHIADKITLQQTVLTGAATYTLVNNKDAYLDGLVGVRAIDITATLNGNLDGTNISKTISSKTSTVDPIIGAKGRYRIADSSWYIPAYADIGSGGGTTNLTWQVAAGVGKTFNNLIDASLVYRALYYDMKSGAVLQKTTMQGPQLSVTFKF